MKKIKEWKNKNKSLGNEIQKEKGTKLCYRII